MSLEAYIDGICTSIESIPEARRNTLDQAVAFIQSRREREEAANLTFICTHNSRRSHLAQVWCQVAAEHFGVKEVYSWSGGTEATACNIRTVNALRRTGLHIENTTGGDNPVYDLIVSDEKPLLRLYSKTFATAENPQAGYAAMMCCSDVDENCPVVFGAALRIPLHYQDPKESDDLPEESEIYDQRCAEIATEMFYILSKCAD